MSMICLVAIKAYFKSYNSINRGYMINVYIHLSVITRNAYFHSSVDMSKMVGYISSSCFVLAYSKDEIRKSYFLRQI